MPFYGQTIATLWLQSRITTALSYDCYAIAKICMATIG